MCGRPLGEGTWINSGDIINASSTVRAGYAHSIEVWEGGELVMVCTVSRRMLFSAVVDVLRSGKRLKTALLVFCS